MDYYSYFCQKVLSVVLNYLSSTLILKLSPVVSAVQVILVNQTKEIWRDFTRFAIISKPNLQITQNKNHVEANYIAYHIIVNFFKTDKQLSQKKCSYNPNTIKSYKILQKLSPKHAAHGVAQSTYPNFRHGKACLSKQPPWRAAGDPRLARGRSRVRAPGPAGALRALFFSTLPAFLLPEIVFCAPSPPTPQKC